MNQVKKIHEMLDSRDFKLFELGFQLMEGLELTKEVLVK